MYGTKGPKKISGGNVRRHTKVFQEWEKNWRLIDKHSIPGDNFKVRLLENIIMPWKNFQGMLSKQEMQ